MSQNEEVQKLIDSEATLCNEAFSELISANKVNPTPPPPLPQETQPQSEGSNSNEQ
jgi:hypothetical protein